MPNEPVLLDISRLVWRVARRGPSGIDRIELEYARHFLLPRAARRLEMGLTTYPIKHDLGARSVPIKMALRTVIGATNRLVPLIYPLVNSPPPAHDKNIFKADAAPPKRRSNEGGTARNIRKR